MLQQTQVATALPYYDRWMMRFPTVEDLARADEQDVLAAWQGLGYYRRCRMLLDGARRVAREGVPTSAAAWRDVPGVGRYTAGAIASIAFGEPASIVDGNVERVFARLTACSDSGTDLHRHAWSWAEANVHPTAPGDWNQALMELGATVCTPSRPTCGTCPLSTECRARSLGLQETLPVHKPRPQRIDLLQVVWVPVFEDRLGLRRIESGPWWVGMWEFPRVSQGQEDDLRSWVGEAQLESLGDVRHTVTRHRIHIRAFLARPESASRELRWVEAERLEDLPMPAPQRRILKLFGDVGS
jgi:A/G-specific adenine glycosylase